MIDAQNTEPERSSTHGCAARRDNDQAGRVEQATLTLSALALMNATNRDPYVASTLIRAAWVKRLQPLWPPVTNAFSRRRGAASEGCRYQPA